MECVREARIKVNPKEAEGSYHCWTRTVNKEHLFGVVAKEVLRRQIWQVADYCGIEVVTHTVMSNHFHVTIRVPREQPVADAELLRRYRVLYPKPTARQVAQFKAIEALLAENGPEAVKWRQRQLRLMGDISQYMKLLKQRFSIWFNKTHDRIGTLWAERFGSTLIEPGFLLTMVAYIDLNCVRAGMVTDPKEYRFCGYAEAVAGNLAAQKGLRSVVGGRDWEEAQAGYRQVLFGTGGSPRSNAASIPREEVQRVLAQGGKLALATILRCRVRYFSGGGVLGSRAYVLEQQAACRRKTGQRQGTGPHELPPCTDWGDVTTLRKLRKRTIG